MTLRELVWSSPDKLGKSLSNMEKFSLKIKQKIDVPPTMNTLSEKKNEHFPYCFGGNFVKKT